MQVLNAITFSFYKFLVINEIKKTMIFFCFRNDTDDSIKTAFLVILALALAGVIVFFFILFYKRKSLNLERFFKGIKTLNTTFYI